MQDEKALQLFYKILIKTRTKALHWEPTAQAGVYIAAIGGGLVLKVWPFTFADEDGEHGPPSLTLNDEKNEILADITTSIDGISAEDLRELSERAKRMALKVDESMDAAIGHLDKLPDEDIPL